MPIFEKDERRVMFSHIPKCGGVSIYSSFVGSGWAIKNLRVNRSPHAAFTILQQRYGIQSIEEHGKLFRYPHSPQHAPYLIWRTWGPFDASFAIVREPTSRLLSALRYHHRTTNDLRSFPEYAKDMLAKALSRPWSHLRMLHGHLIPQYHFIGRDTEIFRFEEDWGERISKRFCVAPPLQDNKAPDGPDELPSAWHLAARRLYRKDYERFGY